jgi:Peptidase family S41
MPSHSAPQPRARALARTTRASRSRQLDGDTLVISAEDFASDVFPLELVAGDAQVARGLRQAVGEHAGELPQELDRQAMLSALRADAELPPDLEGKAPPGVARSNHGFGVSERLRGKVALLVINGFPPPFDEQKAAIGDRLSELTDADALIVDLRNNGGGFPPTEVLVASHSSTKSPCC